MPGPGITVPGPGLSHRRDDVTLTKFPRPCPIPGHPQDDAPAPLAPDSAWSRLRAWHLHAPAERLPLPLS